MRARRCDRPPAVGQDPADALGDVALRHALARLRGGPGSVGLPRRGVAEPGALEHLQREQRALHARRGDVDPEQLEDELAVEAQQVVDGHADDLVGGHRRRGLGDRAAVPGEGEVRDAALVVDAQLDLQLVAAERVVVLGLEVGLRPLAPVMRALVVLEDVLPVQVVHDYAKTSWTAAMPSISRSASSRVEWTAKDARVVAGTPRRRISGWAQWCPARTQPPRRPRISAASCGWMPSSANEQTEPRRSMSRGPCSVSPSTSSRRSTA